MAGSHSDSEHLTSLDGAPPIDTDPEHRPASPHNQENQPYREQYTTGPEGLPTPTSEAASEKEEDDKQVNGDTKPEDEDAGVEQERGGDEPEGEADGGEHEGEVVSVEQGAEVDGPYEYAERNEVDGEYPAADRVPEPDYRDEDSEEEDRKLRKRTKHASKQVKPYVEYIQLMEDRVSRLEEKTRKLEGREEEIKKRNQKPVTTIVPKLQRVKWIDFMYRSVTDQDVSAIEVLVGGARYYYQRSEWTGGGPNDTSEAQGASTKTASLVPDGSSAVRRELPERMRVNSNRVISILADMDPGTYFAMEPFVMLRPYKYLICHETKIRAYLQRLEDKWGDIVREQDSRTTEDPYIVDDGGNENSGNDLNINTEEAPPSPLIEPVNGAVTHQETEGGVPQDSEEPDANEPQAEVPQEVEEELNGVADHADPESVEETQPEVLDEVPVDNEVPRQAADKPSPEEMIDSPDSLRDFRCLVEFIDQELRPTIDKFEDATHRKVYFSDLWHLFKPGEEVLTSLANKSGDLIQEKSNGKDASGPTPLVFRRGNERYQTAWRVLRTVNGRPNLTSGDEDDNEDDPPKVRMNAFQLRCYYIDFDGKRFCPVTHLFKIKPFEGLRDVNSLEIYPTRFAENATAVRDTLVKRGQMFREFTTFKHRYYTGATLVCHPCGCALGDVDHSRYPENIDSQVIVDFHEALQGNGDWFPPTSLVETLAQSEREADEQYPAAAWKGHDERFVSQRDLGALFLDTRVDEKLRDEFMLGNHLLGTESDLLWLSSSGSGSGELNNDDLVLLPARVYAFVLRDRKFAMLRIENLRPVRPQTDGFNSLKLPHGHKRMVKALVKSHFNAKDSKLADADEEHEFDLVRGKGKGLIVLLHGAPGVGKTSTAECVAESNGKPLFPITCGDLGLTPQEVEKELHQKFHLAQQWDCVLLLDEADVFLAQRTKTDIKRNSLVSVFLRVLEYYTGILFLTTNRVGAFDEAFKSRIHISLYYPPLSRDQTVSIWQMNMERTMDRKKGTMLIEGQEVMDFACAHYDESSKNARWNGRQIRNAFQTAAALAEYESYEEHSKRKKGDPDQTVMENFIPPRPKLEIKHFKIVAQASLQFDEYITETTGFTEAERAQQNLDRADHYRSRSYGYREHSASFRSAQGPPPGPEQWAPQQQSLSTGPYQPASRQQPPSQRPPYQYAPPPGQPATPPPPQRSARYPPPQYMTPEPPLQNFPPQQAPDSASPWQRAEESVSKTTVASRRTDTHYPEHSPMGIGMGPARTIEGGPGFEVSGRGGYDGGSGGFDGRRVEEIRGRYDYGEDDY